MDLVGSGLCFDLHNHATSLRKLRIEIAGRSIESLHRIDGRIDDNYAQHWVIIIHAIDHEIGSAKELPVCSNLDSPLRVLRLTVLPRIFCSPRKQQFQFRKISIKDGEGRHLLRCQVRADRGPVGLDKWRRSVDHNGLGGSPNLQRHIGLNRCLKPFVLDGNLVSAGGEVCERVVPRIVGSRRLRNAFFYVCGRDLRVWNSSSAWVCSRAYDGSESCLPVCGLRQESKRSRYKQTGCQNPPKSFHEVPPRFTPGSHYELAGPVKHTPLSGWAKLCTDHSPRRLTAKIRMDSIKDNPSILLYSQWV